MELSVVIVNYNVKHFLEQCLHSVYKSLEGIEGEVFVVDNNSVDASAQMVLEKFPEVSLIVNKNNVGFAKANNQAIREAKGKYVLLLNPDTIVQESTFKQCIQFMDANEDAGSLGVKMIDGKGVFLPESKRSLPTPAVAFYKIFGLASLFPRSKVFGRYHLGYLNDEETHKVEVLAGAFMFIRKSVLDDIGLLDESFFMYGEDIDLSYRIEKSGYANYYFPETTIIHYKGESTKKGSINYVLVFYKAMILFAKKHFSKKNAKLYSFLIYFAIYIRASLSILRRIIFNTLPPLLDFTTIYTGFYFLSPYWQELRLGIKLIYPDRYFLFVVPTYILIWIFTLFISGGYNKKVKPIQLIRSIFLGSMGILLIYALLPESLRFSRGLIILGTIWALAMVFSVRLFFGVFAKKIIKIEFKKSIKQLLLIGEKDEAERAASILKNAEIAPVFVGRVSPKTDQSEPGTLGHIGQIDEIIKINKVDELVFCAKNLKSEEIIKIMLAVKDVSVDFKIAPPESLSIIGSNSIDTAGDLYVLNFNSLNKDITKRKKRVFDILAAIVLIFFSPVLCLFITKPLGLFRNCFQVLFGVKTWVGFCSEQPQNKSLPAIQPGVLTPMDAYPNKTANEQLVEKIDLLYAKDYKIVQDLRILLSGYQNLGR